MSIINEVSKSAGQFAKKELKGVTSKVFVEEKSPILQADEFVKKAGITWTGEPTDPAEFMEQFPKLQRKLFGNPDTIQFKAKHNKKGRFSILGFLAKKNGKTVSKGAVSLTDGGSENAVLKTHIVSGKNGSRMSYNAFVDCSKELGEIDHRLFLSDKGLGLDTKAGDAAAEHINVQKSQVWNVLKGLDLDGDINNNIKYSKEIFKGVMDDIKGPKREFVGPDFYVKGYEKCKHFE